MSGGRSVAKIPRTNFGGFASFESASTLAEGLFDDLDGAIALSNHEVREDSLTATTRVRAEVRKLTVGRDQRLKIARLAAELQARSPGVSGEPPIVPGDTLVEGVTIGNDVVIGAFSASGMSDRAEIVNRT